MIQADALFGFFLGFLLCKSSFGKPCGSTNFSNINKFVSQKYCSVWLDDTFESPSLEPAKQSNGLPGEFTWIRLWPWRPETNIP